MSITDDIVVVGKHNGSSNDNRMSNILYKRYYLFDNWWIGATFGDIGPQVKSFRSYGRNDINQWSTAEPIIHTGVHSTKGGVVVVVTRVAPQYWDTVKINCIIGTIGVVLRWLVEQERRQHSSTTPLTVRWKWLMSLSLLSNENMERLGLSSELSEDTISLSFHKSSNDSNATLVWNFKTFNSINIFFKI